MLAVVKEYSPQPSRGRMRPSVFVDRRVLFGPKREGLLGDVAGASLAVRAGFCPPSASQDGSARIFASHQSNAKRRREKTGQRGPRTHLSSIRSAFLRE